MANREIVIAGQTLVHGQGVKESIDKSNADSVVCFDETITMGAENISYKLEIDRIVFEGMGAYKRLSAVLQTMLSQKRDISTFEIIRYKNAAPYMITKHFHGCILDGRDYEMKPEEFSAQNLTFLCESMEEIVEVYNGD
jgi:hypothetical protein